MKNKHIKMCLIVGIASLFFAASIAPMVIGYNAEPKESDKHLADLRFVCTDANGFDKARFEHYKERLLRDLSNNGITIEAEKKESKIRMPIEHPSSPASSGPMNSPWPMKCHDLRHTSQSPYSTADNSYNEKWRFKCDWMEASATIGDDGTIYFGDLDWWFYALYPNGALKWKYETGGLIWSTPAIAEDGTIYIGSWDDYLHAIYPNGTRKWKFHANSADIASSPAIAEDGTIYFGTLWSLGDGGKIHAVNPDGTEKWHYQTGYTITSDPAIGDDGTVYIGSGDTYLYALWPNGTLRWRFKTGDEIHGHPSIADDGTIYIGSYDDYLYALYPNGNMRWKIKLGYGTSGNPSIGVDGTIYFPSDKLYAVYLNGTKKWSFSLGTNQMIDKSSPAISADGTIYVGTHMSDLDGGFIVAVNPNGTERWSKKIANEGCYSSPAIAEDGTIYIGVTGGIGSNSWLYAFGVGELEADANGPYYGLINQPVQFTGSATGGYTPYDWHWDFGDTYTSEEQNPTHIYTLPGNYTVILTVTDNTSNTSSDSDITWAWIQETNTPPNKPNIDGPTSGNAGTSYDYTFSVIDRDGSIIYLYIEWGDNTNSGWIGPYDSGEQITMSHTWSSQGTYTIKAKAKDPYDDEGPWGELEVTMPVNYQISQQSSTTLFFQILQRILNTR